MVDWKPLSYGLMAPMTAATRPALLVSILLPAQSILQALPYIGCIGIVLLGRVAVSLTFEEIESFDWWVTLPRFAPYSTPYGVVMRLLGYTAIPLAGVVVGFPLSNAVLLFVNYPTLLGG